MTVALVVAMLLSGLVTVVVLAVVTVRATDQLRVLADRLLAMRDEVVPVARQLQRDVDRARAHAERIRATGWRADDEPPAEA